MAGNIAKRGRRKLVLLIIELIIVAILAVGLFVFSKLDKIQTTALNMDNIKVNDVDEATLKSFTGYTTIALFGLDNREQGSLSNGNSDLIMLVAMNNESREVNVVSVYRDTFLDVGEDETDLRKCNAAYSYGGYERAINMLNKNLDLSIDSYCTFDFSAVANAIDILDGVDIEIESEEELKYLNKYIKHTNGILKTKSKKVKGTGMQTLDGVQAVAYARIRYTSGGDYKRAKRQRIVLSAMMKKMKTANLSQLNKIVDTVFPQIETSLSKTDLITMARVLLSYDMSNSRGFPFYRTTMTVGKKGSCVVPCDLEKNVTELQEFMYGNKEYTPSETVQNYNSMIINTTGLTADSAAHDDFEDSDKAAAEAEEAAEAEGDSEGDSDLDE